MTGVQTCALPIYPGENVGCGKDHTLFALKDGVIQFTVKGEKKRRTVSIVPAAE